MADKERQIIEGRRLDPHETGDEDVFRPFPAASAPPGSTSASAFLGGLKPLPILSYMDKIRVWGGTAKNAGDDSAPLSGHFDTTMPVSGDIAPDEVFAWPGADMILAGGEFPPDMAGAFDGVVFLEVTRGRFNLWTGPGILFSSVSLNGFWSGIQVGGVFGPRILYDQFTNRFVHIAIDRQDTVFGPTNKILFAVSEPFDPTVWFRTSLLAGVAPFPSAKTNHVQLGADDLGYYIAADLDTLGLSSVWVVDKGPLATLPPTTLPPVPGSGLGTVSVFHWGPAGGVVGLVPVHTWLQNEPSFGREYFVGTPTPGSADWPAFRMFEVSGPRSAPIFATTGLLPAAPYFPPPLAPALGSAPDIRDGVGDYRLRNAVYRLDDRLQPTGSIWTCMSSISGGRAAPLWFELDPVPPLGPGSVRQTGFVDDPVHHYFNPSIMVNRNGGAVMGFSGSFAADFVGAYYTGRLPTDPPGAMGPVLPTRLGDTKYINLDPSTFNIWGRYSATVLDPFTEELFLTMQEYAFVPPDTWGSWIAGLEFLTRGLTVVVSPAAADSAGATVDQLPPPPYFQGDDVILTANDVTGDWIFDRWEDDLTGTANPDTVTMDTGKTVTAVFTQVEYTIDTTVLPAGAVGAGATVTLGPGPYHLDDIVPATANDSGGWMFDKWTGDLSGGVNPENLTIDGNKDITAVFIGPTLDIAIQPAQAVVDGATVDTVPPPPFGADEVVELTANAPPLWRFDRWEDDLSGDDNPADITMDSPKAVTAVFEGKFHAADVRDLLFVGGPGSPNPDFKVEIDESITYYSAWLSSTPWPAGGPSPPTIDWAVTGFVLFLQNDGRYYHMDSASEPVDAWPTGGMVVTPPDDISESGPPGGPFAGSRIYTVTNLTGGPIDYSVAKAVGWVGLDGGDGPAAGTLAPLASAQVTVGIDSDANALPVGGHADVVKFFNLTGGTGDTTRLVKLDVAVTTTAPPTTAPPVTTTAPPATTAPATTTPPPLTTTAPPATTAPATTVPPATTAPATTAPPTTTAPATTAPPLFGKSYVQFPDIADPPAPTGIDIKCSQFDAVGAPTPLIVADEWLCPGSGPVTNITIWTSLLSDTEPTPITDFELSIHGNIPDGGGGFPVPGPVLWTKTFSAPTEFTRSPFAVVTNSEWWLDPPAGAPIHPGDTVVELVDFPIPVGEAFEQTFGETYWLSVRIHVLPGVPVTEAGWKTRDPGDGFSGKAAVWALAPGVPVPGSWSALAYLPPHPLAISQLDMAFVVFTPDTLPTTLPPTTLPPP